MPRAHAHKSPAPARQQASSQTDVQMPHRKEVCISAPVQCVQVLRQVRNGVDDCQDLGGIDHLLLEGHPASTYTV